MIKEYKLFHGVFFACLLFSVFVLAQDKKAPYALVTSEGKRLIENVEAIGNTESPYWRLIEKDGERSLVNYKGDYLVKGGLDYLNRSKLGKNYAFLKNLKGMTGVVDRSGKTVLPYEYLNVELLDGKYFAVAQSSPENSLLYGLLDVQGNAALPMEYEHIQSSSAEGMFIVQKNKKKGLVNTQNKIIVPFNYEGIYFLKPFNLFVAFNGGSVRNLNLWCKEAFFYDLEGRKLNSKALTGFRMENWMYDKEAGEHSLPLVVYDDYKSCLMEKTGKIIKSTAYERIKLHPSGIYEFYQLNEGMEDFEGDYGVNDYQYGVGKLGSDDILPLQACVPPFVFGDKIMLNDGGYSNNGSTQGFIGGAWKVLDDKGKNVFDKIGQEPIGGAKEIYQSRYALVSLGCVTEKTEEDLFEIEGEADDECDKKRYWHIISPDLKLSPQKYLEVEAEQDGLFIVRKKDAEGNMLKGVVDFDGKTVVPFEYSQIYFYGQGSKLISVKKNDGLKGVFDATGKEIVPCAYTDLWLYLKDACFWVSKDGKYGYLGLDGKVLFEARYDFSAGYYKGSAWVKEE